MILNFNAIIFSLFFIACLTNTDGIKVSKERNNGIGIDRIYVIESINKFRARGCKCGGEYFPPASALEWNEVLYKSAFLHAKSMYEENYFSHISPDGKDVGDRLDVLGYKWQYAGENLGEGQKNFDEVMHDWIESPTHCKMMMNPNMKEIGVAKYNKFWVQHFGTQMPPKTKRVGRTYTEGGE
ncbi:MAG: CAP domain-containing protein [Saprospiraceae bacterium]|nr:CAP domain-containing protein [Saprospiraceae bacterium]